MPVKQKTGLITSLLFSLLVIILFIGACIGIPGDTMTPQVNPQTGTPAASAADSITLYGTVSDLNRMNCPCFTLVTGTGNVTVWYDLMIGPDGTRKPPVAIDSLADGMEIRVNGTQQAKGKFWANAISTTRP